MQCFLNEFKHCMCEENHAEYNKSFDRFNITFVNISGYQTRKTPELVLCVVDTPETLQWVCGQKVAQLFCLLGACVLFRSAIYCQRAQVHFHSASSARLLIHVGVVNITHVYTPLVSVNILTLNSSSRPTRSSGALVLWSFCRCPSREDTSSSVSPYRKYSSRAW